MPEIVLRNEDIEQLKDWVEGIIDLAASVWSFAPSPKLQRLIGVLEAARETGKDFKLEEI